MYRLLRTNMIMCLLSICSYNVAIEKIACENNTKNDNVYVTYIKNKTERQKTVSPGIISSEKRETLGQAGAITALQYSVGTKGPFAVEHIPHKIDQQYPDRHRNFFHQPNADNKDPDKFDAILCINGAEDSKWTIGEKKRESIT